MKSAFPVVLVCVLVIHLVLLPNAAIAQTEKFDTFFFFAILEPFGVYTGACSGVETPSGNVNFECTLDLLFGDPVTAATPVSLELMDLPASASPTKRCVAT